MINFVVSKDLCQIDFYIVEIIFIESKIVLTTLSEVDLPPLKVSST